MEGFLRANIMLSRMRRYPRHQHSQHTNDFVVYCELTISSYLSGTTVFQECFDIPDDLRAVLKELQNPSTRIWLLSRSLNERAQVYINEKREQEEGG
jgi:hypothetical protein